MRSISDFIGEAVFNASSISSGEVYIENMYSARSLEEFDTAARTLIPALDALRCKQTQTLQPRRGSYIEFVTSEDTGDAIREVFFGDPEDPDMTAYISFDRWGHKGVYVYDSWEGFNYGCLRYKMNPRGMDLYHSCVDALRPYIKRRWNQ